MSFLEACYYEGPVEKVAVEGNDNDISVTIS